MISTDSNHNRDPRVIDGEVVEPNSIIFQFTVKFQAICERLFFNHYYIFAIGQKIKLEFEQEQICKCNIHLVSTDSINNRDPRVIDGEVVEPNSIIFQFTVKVQAFWKDCGGALLTPSCVLTAAHCRSEVLIS